jgi:hypothetical protein
LEAFFNLSQLYQDSVPVRNAVSVEMR